MMNRIRVRLVLLLFCTLCATSCTSIRTPYPYFSGSSYDGRYGVFGDREKGQVVLKEITTGRIVRVWDNNIFDVIGGAVGFTPDKRCFVLPIKNSIELWKLRDGTLSKTLVTNSKTDSFAINSTNTYLAASDASDEEVRINLWDLDDGRRLWQIPFAGSRLVDVPILGYNILSKRMMVSYLVKILDFSHDGKYLAGGSNEFIKIYAIPSGKEMNCIALNPPRYPNTGGNMGSLGFSKEDSCIAAGIDNKLFLWDSRTGRLKWSIIDDMPISGIDFYPGDQYMITYSVDRTQSSAVKNFTVKIRKVNDGRLVTVRQIQNIVGSSHEGQIFAWNPESNKVITYLWSREQIDMLTGTPLAIGIENIIAKVASEMRSKGWERVAIFEFKPQNDSYSDFERYLMAELAYRFEDTKGFSVVEKHLFERAPSVLKMTTADLINRLSDTKFSVKPEAVKKFGELTSVDTLLMVTITDKINTIEIRSYLVDTETGEVHDVAPEEIVKDKNILKYTKDLVE